MKNSMLYQPHLDNQGSQSARQLARRLAAYLPVTVTRQILRDELPQPGEARWVETATLFADMSGFTFMAEALAADGPRGAEELNRTLLITFTALIKAIHDAEGAVSHFHGDAMMVYFLDTDGRAAARALACARFMQSLMLSSFAQMSIRRVGNEEMVFSLTIKIGVGYGRSLETIVGHPKKGMEFVLAGTAVDEAVTAQQNAESGQVVASQKVLLKAGLPATEPFRVVDEVPPVPNAQPPFYWESIDQEAINRVIKIAPAFIPEALFSRLQNQNTQFVAEHRTVTSMFVRFEGIDFDHPDAGEKLQAYYQWASAIVAKYGGVNSRVNRLLTGDKGSQLHIIFGAPVAPNLPVQAMRCALALQVKKPMFITRQQIGIAAGHVFACAVGSQNRREYTTVGSVVNLSARLTDYCPDGTIYTDAFTVSRCREMIDFEQLQPVQLKGTSKPIPLYRVVGQKQGSMIKARFTRAERPPFGRDEELAQVRQCAQLAFQGNGRIAALFGSFGSGQMPLLAATAHQWLESGGLVYTGVCQLHLSDLPFAPWQAVWRDIFGLTADMDALQQVETVLTRAANLCPDCGVDNQLWVELLGLNPQRVSDTQISRSIEGRQAALFTLMQRSLVAAARVQPLLIILEDIHWADQLSLDLIDDLALAVENIPVLLLLTYRTASDFHFRTLNRANCIAIPLEDLSPERARQLVLAELGSDELPMLMEQRLGLRDRLGRTSPVNPLFLEESLKMMLANGLVRVHTESDGRRRVRINETAVLQMQVPETIYNVLLSRLDQLSAAERSLLQVAAVIGREFDLATLVMIMPGMRREEAEQLLLQLLETEMVQQIAVEPEQRFIFQHALAHDVVYQSLPYARRQALHAAIGELIASRHQDNLKMFYPVLAYHFSQTDQHEEGLQYALAAADDAAAIYANKAAADLYKSAIVHLSALEEIQYWKTAVYVYRSRAQILQLMGEFTQATLAATEALKLCLLYGEIEQTLPIYNLLAEIKYHQARYADVRMLAQKVINNLGDFTPPFELAQAYLLSGMAAAAVFDLKSALNNLDRAEEICVAVNDRKQLVPVWGAIAGVYSEQHKTELALNTAERAVELAKTNMNQTQIALSQYRLARIQLQAGQPDAALKSINSALNQLRSSSHNLQAHMLTHRAAVYVYSGHFDAALSDLQLVVNLFDQMDDAPGLLQAYLLWGYEFSSGIGDWKGARQRLVQVGQLVASQPEEAGMYVQEAARLWLGLGVVALHMNHFSQAETLFQKAMRAIDARQLTWWRAAALYYLGRVKMARRQPAAEVEPYLRQALQAVYDGGCTDDLPLILLQLARLSEEEDQRVQFLETAVSAAFQRSRYADKVSCFQEAGSQLLSAKSERLRRLGGMCLTWLETTQNTSP
jgi:adenylate cyclase